MRTASTAARRSSELERTKADDRLARLYESHALSAARLALVLTGDEQAAQDITQEAFVRIGGRLGGLREPENAAGYLYRTIQNLAKGHGRGLSRQRRLARRLEQVAARPTMDSERDDRVWQALFRLPLRQRTALFLRYYLDLSEADTALALDCSVPAAKSLTHRATQALRSQIEGEAR